jgi:hypothetical protein
VPALGVTDGVLPILEVTPLFGRPFTRADDEPGSSDVVMITYGYWHSKFGGERSVIGKTIDIDGKPSTIIGVLPQRFRFLDMTNLGILLPLRPRTQRGFNYFAVARLKPAVTLAEANADVARMIPMELKGELEGFPEAAKFFKESRIRPNLQPLKEYIIPVGFDGWDRPGAADRLCKRGQPSFGQSSRATTGAVYSSGFGRQPRTYRWRFVA